MAGTKYDPEVVQKGLRAKLDEPTSRTVFHEINRLASEKAAGQPEAGPAPKLVLTVIRPEETTEIAWVVAADEEIPPAEIPNRLNLAIAEYNDSRRGRLLPVKTLGEGLEIVPNKTFSGYGISIRTKLPVALLPVSSELRVEMPQEAIGQVASPALPPTGAP